MNPFDKLIAAFMVHPKIEGALAVLAIATASAMPPKIPACAQDWWTWLRTALRASLPVNHETPQPPEPPAKEQP